MARATASTSGHVAGEANSSQQADHAGVRTRAVRAREAKLEELAATREHQIAELFVAVRDKPKYTDFEAGLSGRKRRKLVDATKDDQVSLPGLKDFKREYASAESLQRLDIALPPLSPAPASEADPSGGRQAEAVIAPPLADDLAIKDVVVDDSEEDAEGEVDEDLPMAPVPAPAPTPAGQVQTGRNESAPERRAQPTPSTSAAPQIALTAPSASPAPSPASGAPSASTSTQSIAPALMQPAPSPVPSPAPAAADAPYFPPPVYSSQFGIHEVSSDYVEALPPVPSGVLRQRLNAALLLRASNKKASKSSAAQAVQPDLYKLHVRSQHMSAKSFLGPGKRVHNVLDTKEWEVGIDEMRAIRAFERIEELKAERKWSFRQPKKQRTGVVPKAHWDHVLDEMRWMQTDFRQERRWKVVTAYTIARDCRAYVRASPSDRSKLVVPTRPPRTLTDSEIEARMNGPPTSGEVPPAGAEDLEPAASGHGGEKDVDEDDQDAEGEPDDDAGVRVVAASASDAVKDAVPVASAPTGAGKAGGSAGDEATVTAAAPSSRSQAEANKVHSQAQHIQNLITFRNPIFDASVADTTISSSDLAFIRDAAAGGEEKAESTEDDPFLGYDFAVLFPDLPLYSDFAIANDPSLARRVEDSSAWSGRLAQVTRLLEIKPTLVSTLQPGRTRTDKGWSPALIDALEDVKDSMSTGEAPVPAAASTLFAGRKPKDVATGELLVKPQEVPHAEIRATAILWLPEEDALLLALQKQYGLNWSLIAQVFNSTTHRPESDYRLAWDVYDRWDKLVGPGSKKLLPDGTEIVRPPPEWLPPVDRTGRPMPVIADGSKKKTRHAMIVEAMKKVQKKREGYAAKQPAAGFPRRINMAMHESHNIPPRPNWTPMEWSIYKAEQEAQKLRLRQQQQAQVQAAAAMRQQQAQQNAAGLQQSRPPSSLPPQIAAAHAAARASPTGSAATLPGSPNAGHSSASPRHAPQQLGGHAPNQQLNGDQIAALQARQRELLQAQAQAIAAQRAAQQQQQQQQR